MEDKEENSKQEHPLVFSSRLDITVQLLHQCMERNTWNDFLQALSKTTTVETVHFSASSFDTVLKNNTLEERQQQLKDLCSCLQNMPSLKEFFCFRGGSQLLTEDMLATALSKDLRVVMLWEFTNLPESLSSSLPATLSKLHHLERLTIKVPPRGRNNTKKSYAWGCMDVYAMAWAGLPRLRALQLKCAGFRPREPLISPEALGVLISGSPSIETLYLENCGLLDEHMDVMAEELPNNTMLQSIDLQENYLTDDTLFTMGRMFRQHPHNKMAPLRFLNLSGVHPITESAGNALIEGFEHNHTIQNLELEGTAARYADEFDIPLSPHAECDWFARLDLRLRLNRAYHEAPRIHESSSLDFCQALNSVSDHASGLFHFVRHHVKYSVALSPMARRNRQQSVQE